MHASLRERQALCDLFVQVGAEAPTLCEGWTTRDLAAHLLVRERRPDAAPGLVIGPLAGWTKRVQDGAATRDFAEIVDDLRDGPPLWAMGRWVPDMDLHEFFVHHEDVRRANDLPPREDDELDAAIWKVLGRWAKLLTRRTGMGVTLHTHEGEERVVRTGDPSVTLVGRPGELMLRLFGREAAVTVEGDDEAVRRFDAADLGI